VGKVDVLIPILLLILLAFFLISWLFPAYWNWSIISLADISPLYYIAIAMISVLSVLPNFSMSLSKKLLSWLISIHNKLNRLSSIPRLLLWIFIPALILFGVKSNCHILGDGNLILSHISEGDLISTTAIGISLLVKYGFKLQNAITGLDAAAFMQFISIISGIIFIYFTYRNLAFLIHEIRMRLVLFLILCTSAIIILFTGYVETYPILSAWLAVYIFYSLKFIKSGNGFYTSLILFFTGVFWHIWFLAFFPSLLYIFSLRFKNISSKMTIILSCLFVLGIYGGGLFIKRTGIPLVLPFLPTENSHYVLFSPAHLLDYVNQLVIIGPVMTLLTLSLLVLKLRDKYSLALRFLLYASLPALMIAFLIDPALGAIRDWDLLSIFALPLFLAGMILFSDIIKSKPNLCYLTIPILLIGILHTSGFILNNKNEDMAVTRVVNTLLDDPHYQIDYHQGKRNTPFATILSNAYNRHKDGTLFMQKKTDTNRADYSDYLTLANQYYNDQDFENAQHYYSLIPNDLLSELKFRLSYGESLFKTSRYSKAVEQLKIIQKDSSFSKLHYLLGCSYLGQGFPDSAVKYYDLAYVVETDTLTFLKNTAHNFIFFKYYTYAIEYYKTLYKLYPDFDGLLNEMATTYHSLQQTDSAYKYYSMILKIDPESYSTLLNMSHLYIEAGDFEKAMIILDRTDRIYPRDALVLSKIGYVLQNLNRHQEALKTLELALEIKPDDINILHLIASAYYRVDSLWQAIAQWDSILEIDSGFVTAYYWQAQCYDKLDEGLMAKNKLTTWLRINPNGKTSNNAQPLLRKYNLLD